MNDTNKLIGSVRRNEPEAVESLLRAGVNPDLRDADQQTALMWAAQVGNSRILRTLLSRGADPNLRDQNERTALHHAVVAQSLVTVGTLLESGADANLEDIWGQTPLQLSENLQIQTRLLDVTACSDAERAEIEHQRRTPLEITTVNVTYAMSRVLRELRRRLVLASPDAPCDGGMLHVAYHGTDDIYQPSFSGFKKGRLLRDERVMLPVSIAVEGEVRDWSSASEFVQSACESAIQIAEESFHRASVPFASDIIRRVLSKLPDTEPPR